MDIEGEGLVSDNRDVGFINAKDFRYETSGCEFEEINNEIKPINSIQKKIVIAVSNSTITLSDDIHNILISHHYNDKKDEEVFVGEIIDKYFNELKRLTRKHILKVGAL
jgi:soluble P-type ATPase